jgi:hypothetical protein
LKASVTDISTVAKRKAIKKKMTKKPELKLPPIYKVEKYEHGKMILQYWAIRLPDGSEVACKSYEDAKEMADKYEMHLPVRCPSSIGGNE